MGQVPDMRDVDVVEVGAEVQPGSPVPGGPQAPHTTGDVDGRGGEFLRRRRPRGLVPAVAAMVLLAGSMAVVETGRDASRLTALADVPEVLAPLDGPVRVLWALPDARAVPRDVEGRLVVPVHAARRATDVVAMDARTGAELWRTSVAPPAVGADTGARCHAPTAGAAADPGRPGTARATGRGDTAGVPATAAPTPPSRVVVCVVADDTETADLVGVGSRTYPTRVRLVVLDAADGAVLRDDVVPPSTTVTALGADVLLAHVDDARAARLTRTDALGRVERWSFRSPDGAVPDRPGQGHVSVETDGGLVVLDAGPVWVLDAEGQLLRSWDRGEPKLGSRGVQLLADRGLVVRSALDAAGRWSGDVLDVRTGRSFTVDGYPAPVRPDDGSLDDVLLVERGDGSGGTAYDVATGQPLWSRTVSAGGTHVVIDGRVVRLDPDGLRAVDGRTGAVVWTTPFVQAGHSGLVTDGRVVLARTAGERGAGTITAFGLDDGRPRWSSELGVDAYLHVVDRRLYGYTPEGLVVLGDPRE